MKGVRKIELPVYGDGRGSLSFIEKGADLPFDVKRMYFLYDVPSDQNRGHHAHKNLRQCIFAFSGSFKVRFKDGKGNECDFLLTKPNECLLVELPLWRELDDFSQGAMCVVLASDCYGEDDYIRNYQDFIDYVS